ncbi:hypothetical protein [Komagataeibacter sucrofermentans]|nr:hypothetical protein [Komagataeibacter sucrofermentans]
MIWLIPIYECEKAYIQTHDWRRFEAEPDRLDPDSAPAADPASMGHEYQALICLKKFSQ